MNIFFFKPAFLLTYMSFALDFLRFKFCMDKPYFQVFPQFCVIWAGFV